MRRSFAIFVVAVALGMVARPAQAGQVVDRIVATVNGHIILQSDWDDELYFEAFTAGHQVDQLSASDRKGALDRLIDQELLREQTESADFPHVSEEEVGKRIEEVRKEYPTLTTEQQWRDTLTRYRLTEGDLKKRLGLELDLMRLVDARLRPTVQIDSNSIESYYQQELLPQLRNSGAKEVPLAEVTPKIKELLTQQKMNQLLIAWLQNLRAGSDIRTGAGAFLPGGQAQ